MIMFKKLMIQNFISTGMIPQIVSLDRPGLTLILGENLDLEGSGQNSNGVGKTTLIQALCYAIYGRSLTNIRPDNLINKINQKKMLVTLEFQKNGISYKIERGRKPNIFKWYVGDKVIENKENDESQGEGKFTQNEIEKILGVSIHLFKHIIALHTKITPFLSLKSSDQSSIIEELLGITQLSNKAKLLRELLDSTKKEIDHEETKIKVMTNNNDRVNKHIKELQFKTMVWDSDQTKKIEKLKIKKQELITIDIEEEIKNQKLLSEWSELTRKINDITNNLNKEEKRFNQLNKEIVSVTSNIEKAENHSCPTCGQEIHDSQHEKILSEYATYLEKLLEEQKQIDINIVGYNTELIKYKKLISDIGVKPIIHYKNLEDAIHHQNKIDTTNNDIEREEQSINPYIDQIANLNTTGIQEINYESMHQLEKLREHQEVLLRLLTHKESFIRKKIIDQNLSYLNHRLNHYLDKLNLSYEVEFQNDLSVNITKLGKEYDFDSLSTGESCRVVLSLSWAFRDTWESQNTSINILAIDEMIDSGLDSSGLENSLEILKNMSRKDKTIFLISHKDLLVSRVNKVLMVQKENGFSNIIDTEESTVNE